MGGWRGERMRRSSVRNTLIGMIYCREISLGRRGGLYSDLYSGPVSFLFRKQPNLSHGVERKR